MKQQLKLVAAVLMAVTTAIVGLTLTMFKSYAETIAYSAVNEVTADYKAREEVIVAGFADKIQGLLEENEVLSKEVEVVLNENIVLADENKELKKYADRWLVYTKDFGEPQSTVSKGDVSGESVKLVRKTVNTTAYNEAECDKLPSHRLYGITASGKKVKEWYTIAAGPSIPFGTRIYIPEFKDKENGGIFVVEDRGGAIRDETQTKAGCLDIYVTSLDESFKYGRKYLEAYFIVE